MGQREWAASEVPVESLPDEEVLALADAQMPAGQQAELSRLLERNRDNALDRQGRQQLDDLMRLYERGLLRKAQALRVAALRLNDDPAVEGRRNWVLAGWHPPKE